MKSLYIDKDIARVLFLRAASVFTKNAPFLAMSPLHYEELPDPPLPNPRWLRVKNSACGLCGSDITFMYMKFAPNVFPAATPGVNRVFLGHEVVGEVVETGSEVDNVAVGDRVCLRIDWPSCYQLEIDPMCPNCQQGNYMLCQNLGLAEMPLEDHGGGFSSQMVLHRSQPFKLPPELNDDEAVLIEPLACAVRGVNKSLPQAGERALVVGCGTIGLLTVAAAKALQPEAEVVALARYPFQAEMAKKLGADDVIIGRKDNYQAMAERTNARYIIGQFNNKILLGGYDVVYDSVGSNQSINDALRWVRANGALVIMGINFDPKRIDYTPIWHQELNVTGMNCHGAEPGGLNSFELAASLISDKKVDLDGMVTHHMPMDEYQEAVRMFQGKDGTQAIKIVMHHQ